MECSSTALSKKTSKDKEPKPASSVPGPPNIARKPSLMYGGSVSAMGDTVSLSAKEKAEQEKTKETSTISIEEEMTEEVVEEDTKENKIDEAAVEDEVVDVHEEDKPEETVEEEAVEETTGVAAGSGCPSAVCIVPIVVLKTKTAEPAREGAGATDETKDGATDSPSDACSIISSTVDAWSSSPKPGSSSSSCNSTFC